MVVDGGLAGCLPRCRVLPDVVYPVPGWLVLSNNN